MAESKLTLYKTNITKERNAKVDQIDDYLDSVLVKTVFNHFQYQKLDLNTNIKVAVSQNVQALGVYNYAKLEQDTRSFYFFINKATWKSTGCIELDLTMDTINTFAGWYTFSEKTHITRQHKDRLAVVNLMKEQELSDSDILYQKTDYILDGSKYFDTATAIYALNTLDSCKIISFLDGVETGSWNNVKKVEVKLKNGNYILSFTYTNAGVDQTYDLDDYNTWWANGRAYALRFTGLPIDVQFDSGWSTMFYGIFEKKYRRLIDQEPESINPPQFKINEKLVIDENNKQGNWYLLYRSTDAENPNSPVDVFLIPEEPRKVWLAGSNSINLSNLQNNTYYYFMSKYQWGAANGVHDRRIFEGGITSYAMSNNYGGTAFFGIEYDTDKKTTLQVIGHDKDYGMNSQMSLRLPSTYFVKLYKTATGITMYQYQIYENDFTGNLETRLMGTYNNVSAIQWICSGDKITAYRGPNNYTNSTQIYNNRKNMTVSEWYGIPAPVQLSGINDLDRTQPEMIRLISIPYSIVYTENDRVLTGNWVSDNTSMSEFVALKWQGNNIQDFSQTIFDCEFPYKNLFVDYVAPELSRYRIKNNESKMYNSEFYTPKFVYDSFNYQFQLENIDTSAFALEDQPETIDYKCSNTMNSRFLFKFHHKLKRSTQDYDNICVVARNNELPLFNSSYLNYLRSGYNYDVKNKNAQLEQAGAKIALTTVGAGVGAALAVGAAAGSSVGPVGTAVGAIVGAGIGLVSSIITTAYSQAQADRNIQQKIDTAKQQGVSVSGGDDVDLLTTYTNGNKAKFTEYKCSDRVANTMNDLFYYCGYATDEHGVPNETNRAWFNFVQCEPVFKTEVNTLVYDNYLQDIRQRYQAGITVYHRRNDKYDWDQELENWETNLLQ